MKKEFPRGLFLLIASAIPILFTACGGTGSRSHQNFFQQPPPVQQLAITTTSLAHGTQGQPYSATLQASGGTGSDTWTIVSGALPDDLSLNPTTGLISGLS